MDGLRPEILVLVILLVLSVSAWLWTWFRWGRVQRWWYEAADKRFLKQPGLDVGILFILFLANLFAVGVMIQSLVVKPSGESTPSRPLEMEAPANGTQAQPVGENSTPESMSENEQKPRWVALGFRVVRGTLLMAIAIGLGYWLYGTRLHHWGLGFLNPQRIWATVRASWLGFLLLVPPVLLIHALLRMVIPYHHEQISDFEAAREAGAWEALFVIFLSTAIWTPVVEEFSFRVVIQGFAEQVIRCRDNFMRWLLGPLQPVPAELVGLKEAAKLANRDVVKPVEKPTFSSLTFWGPIVISALLFAFAHVGQGPAPIPLYVLAMGLGFLYKTTGNLLLCILIHAYLNGLTLTLLLFT